MPAAERKPPGPRGVPFFGSLLDFGRDPLGFLTACARQHGDFVAFDLGGWPFGGGPRVCIGNRFAMMEAVLVLAAIARRWRLRWLPERPVEPFPSITLRPAGGGVGAPGTAIAAADRGRRRQPSGRSAFELG